LVGQGFRAAFKTDIEKRAPGSEYRVVESASPEPQLAPVEDWGGKFVVPQEAITRNQVNYLRPTDHPVG
jgi:hypothetical protein